MDEELKAKLIRYGVLLTSDSRVFRLILNTAKYLWEPLHPMPATYLYMGNLVAWGKWHVRARLNYIPDEPEDKSIIQLQVTVANKVRDESIMFHRLISRAATNYKGTKAIFCPETLTVILESSGRCSRYKDEIYRQVRFIFENFIGLINDEYLLAALEMSGANILGAPVDTWDHE